jgi:hypothetical protein
LRLLFAIKNEASYNRKDLQAEGVRAGVPDVMLPVARGGYHGLFLEMKIGANTLSPAQRRFAQLAHGQGYCVCVCWGQDHAWQSLLSYVKGTSVRD